MEGNIIVYRQPSSSKSRQLSRALNGYIDKSNHGKYTYERDGLLDKIPHRKLIKGVFIIKNKHLKKFEDLLKKYQAEYHIRKIELKPEDTEILTNQEE
ncbi:hypothetical protein AKJ40_03950 [candidate division MSBL1 archaeon SCGC-AAA259M10]|uniref:Uncharacterized protein n=2 Tax=candidate division MSBL1 TaxID=215777 RepID=A0A133UY44_9EURY|nr:hypothetical protein AKJ40_03950 [candidate division MSBL1 archaeon SCGC-AAA259M10]